MTNVERPQVQAGMHVVGRDHEPIGRVKEVRADDFLIDRPMQPDVYVPFRLVQGVADGEVVLITQAELLDRGDEQRFPMPGAP